MKLLKSWSTVTEWGSSLISFCGLAGQGFSISFLKNLAMNRGVCHNCYILTWVWIITLPVTSRVLETCHCMSLATQLPPVENVCALASSTSFGVSLTWPHLGSSVLALPKWTMNLTSLLLHIAHARMSQNSHRCAHGFLEGHFISIYPAFSIRPGTQRLIN